MDAFDNREKAYENKFAHDLEVDFKIKARRNYLLGLWVAEKAKLLSDDAEHFAEVFRDQLVEISELGAAFRQTIKEFEEKLIEINEDEILSIIDKFQQQAKEERNNPID